MFKMSIDNIPENNSDKSLNKRTDNSGCSPFLASILMLACLIGARAGCHAKYLHEKKVEREMRHTQRMYESYQKLNREISENLNNPSILPLERRIEKERQHRLYDEIEKIQRETNPEKYQDSDYQY